MTCGVVTIFSLLNYAPKAVIPMLEERVMVHDLVQILEQKCELNTEYEYQLCS